MSQILDLNPSQLTDQFASVLEQINELTQLPTIPAIKLDNLSIPNVDLIPSLAIALGNILQRIPNNSEELIADLLSELKKLSQSSLDLGKSLVSLTTITKSIAPLLEEFNTIFNQLNSELFPTLSSLNNSEVNSSYLQKLFSVTTPAESLSNQFTGVVESRLSALNEIQSLVCDLVEDKVLADYQGIFDAIATIPLDHSLTKAHLSKLEPIQIDQVTSRISTISQNAQATLDKLNSLNQNQPSFSQELKVGLEKFLVEIEPQKIGNSLTIFQNILKTKDELNVAEITPKIKQAITAVENLLSKNIEQVPQSIEEKINGIVESIVTAEQVVVKVSAIAFNLVQQLKEFIQTLDLSSLVNQIQQVFDELAENVNSVLEPVNATLEQIYTSIKPITEKIATLDFKPIIQALHDIVFKLTAFLDRPEVYEALQKAQQGIKDVVQQLEGVTLKPVFDEVITEANNVKAKLAAIDISGLNPMLKETLKTSLQPLREAINPAEVTKAVKAEYDTLVQEEIIANVINPIQEKFNKISQIIDEFNPSTLIRKELEQPFEIMVKKIKQLIEPAQVITLLQPLADFSKLLLDQLNQTLNPSTLLAPLVQPYNQLMIFGQSLQSHILLVPINQLLELTTNQLNQLEAEELINQIIKSVSQISSCVSNFQTKGKEISESIYTILDEGVEQLVSEFIKKIKVGIDDMDLSSLLSIVGGLSAAATTIVQQVNSPSLLEQGQAIINSTQAYAETYQQQMTPLAQAWQKQKKRLADFIPPPTLAADYEALQKQVQALNPIAILAAPMDLINQIPKAAIALDNQLKQIWQELSDSLQQNRHHLDQLLANQSDTFKQYLRQAIEGLIDSSGKELIQGLGQPLATIKEGLISIKRLQKFLPILTLINDKMNPIRYGIINVHEKLMGFNLDFLTEALQDVTQAVIQPLATLHPEILIAPVEPIYQNILKTLESVNPTNIIACAHGTVTLTREATIGEVTIPRGTQLIATTPVGERQFQTIQSQVFAEGQATVEIALQALITGQEGEVVAVEGVAWRMKTVEVALPLLTVSHTAPIVSLTTLGGDEIWQKLEAVHPVKLVKDLLHEPYQKLLDLVNELGFDRIFDALLQKFDKINKELEQELNRLELALSGLLAAIPL